jgi:hypothetical protein
MNTETSNKTNMSNNLNTNQNNTGTRQITTTQENNDESWKEISFKIKLTEPEYKLLLKEKSKLLVNI